MMKTFLVDAFDLIAPRTCNRVRVERRLRKGAFGEPEVSLVPFLCERNKIAIDVGAAEGAYAYVMSKYAKYVHAFEPNNVACKDLRRRMPVNVEIHNVALSNRHGTADFHIPRNSPKLGTIEKENDLAITCDNLDTFSVRTERLDAYDLHDVSFIKIDVEGHELAVLRGAEKTIKQNRPALLVEIERRHTVHPIENTVEYLERIGYCCFFMDCGAIRPFDEFNVEYDQHVDNISIRGKVGRYINNFIFVHSTRDPPLHAADYAKAVQCWRVRRVWTGC